MKGYKKILNRKFRILIRIKKEIALCKKNFYFDV